VGLLAAQLALNLPGVLQSDWTSAAAKTAVFSFLYGGLLLALERGNINMLLGVLGRLR
jgi:hypothetical protein